MPPRSARLLSGRPLVRRLFADDRRRSAPSARAGGDCAVARPLKSQGDIMSALDVVNSALIAIKDVEDVQPVVDAIGDAEFALLGEASHGTHEFYAARAAITRKLIVESGYRAVAIEGDWPDSYRVNRYVQHQGSDTDAVEALSDFKRFPTWMWRNTVVVEFIEWLRAHNDALPPGAAKVGFYGLDL